MANSITELDRRISIIDINDYYYTLIQYKGYIEDREDRGIIDQKKSDKLYGKLNDWYSNHPHHPSTRKKRVSPSTKHGKK